MKRGPDTGGPKYEAARQLMASELISLGMRDKAKHLMRAELYEIEPWIAMQIIARLL